jgi:membrane-bound inhibitor of C-type lysozyme
MMRGVRNAIAVAAFVAAATPAHPQAFTAYQCEDGAQFQVAIFASEKKAYLQLDGHAVQLPKKIAYTGDRYAAGGITFWVRGNGRTTIKRAGKVTECFSVTTPGRG